MQGRPILTPEQLSAHKAFISGQEDVIWNPLYDYQAYTGNAGHTQLTFFSIPIGQGTTSAPGASGTKNLADTNLVTAGSLPANNEFYCTGIELFFMPGVQVGRGAVALADVGEYVDDLWVISKAGWLNFKIQDRSYVKDGPLGLFPETTRMGLSASLGVTFDSDEQGTETVEEVAYAALSGEPYAITPVYIVANQAFQVQLNWSAAQVLPTGQNARIGCRLNGYLIRNAQ